MAVSLNVFSYLIHRHSDILSETAVAAYLCFCIVMYILHTSTEIQQFD